MVEDISLARDLRFYSLFKKKILAVIAIFFTSS